MTFVRSVYNFSSQIAEAAFPVITSNAYQIGLRDSRVGKIFAGTMLLGTGIGLIGKTGVASIVTSHFSESMDISQQVTLSKKPLRWGLAGIGLAMAGTGAYCIFSGIAELASDTFYETQPFALPPASQLSSSEKHDIQAIELEECNRQLNQAAQSLSSCKATNDLWKNVEQQGNFTIECLPKSQINWPAQIDCENRAIYVSTYFPPGTIRTPMEDSIVFELNNLKQAASLLSIQAKMCTMDKYQYAEEIEKIEYRTLRETSAILKSCTEEWSLLSSPQKSQEWKEYLTERMITGHVSAYHLQWTEKCSPEDLKSQMLWLKQLEGFGIPLPSNYNEIAAKLSEKN